MRDGLTRPGSRGRVVEQDRARSTFENDANGVADDARAAGSTAR